MSPSQHTNLLFENVQLSKWWPTVKITVKTTKYLQFYALLSVMIKTYAALSRLLSHKLSCVTLHFFPTAAPSDDKEPLLAPQPGVSTSHCCLITHEKAPGAPQAGKTPC